MSLVVSCRSRLPRYRLYSRGKRPNKRGESLSLLLLLFRLAAGAPDAEPAPPALSDGGAQVAAR